MTDLIKKTPGWVRILLVVSLALNLLLVGLGVGVLLKGKDRGQALSSRAGPVMLRGLSRDERRAIGTKLRQENEARGSGRSASRAARQNVIAALRARPFEADALKDALRHQAELDSARRQVGIDIMVARMASLTDAERAEIADNIQNARRGPNKNAERNRP